MNASSSTGSSIATPVSRPTDVRSAPDSAKVPSGVGDQKGRVQNRHEDATNHPGGSAHPNPPERHNPSRASPLCPDGDASRSQVFLRLRYGILAEMEDRGSQDGAGPAVGQALVEVVEGADPATGDDRHRHRV